MNADKKLPKNRCVASSRPPPPSRIATILKIKAKQAGAITRVLNR